MANRFKCFACGEEYELPIHDPKSERPASLHVCSPERKPYEKDEYEKAVDEAWERNRGFEARIV